MSGRGNLRSDRKNDRRRATGDLLKSHPRRVEEAVEEGVLDWVAWGSFAILYSFVTHFFFLLLAAVLWMGELIGLDLILSFLSDLFGLLLVGLVSVLLLGSLYPLVITWFVCGWVWRGAGI